MTNPLLRREFFGTCSAVVGAVLAAPAALAPAVALAADPQTPRLWTSADILIGSSASEQVPSPVITCPFYLPSGNDAGASHTLDLSAYPVRSDITWHGQTITPDLSQSLAVNTAVGSDGFVYLLVGAEGDVVGATGQLQGVTRAVVRCKYKVVMSQTGPLLVSCVHCVAIMIRP